ncbi:hypothetical protein EXD76_02915 [BEV proteobacterium]|nr:hypothetical protein [Candidatus Symbiopectobacterium sp. Chty_BC]
MAPKPVVYRNGWLIVEWAAGATVSAQDFSGVLENGSLAQLLSQLHYQPCCGFYLNLPAQFIHHWALLNKSELVTTVPHIWSIVT